MHINCVFAGTNASGSPDFGFVRVSCEEGQYGRGEHYAAVAKWAADHDYESPFVVFDQNDGPVWLFDRFAWMDAANIHALQL